MKFLRNSILSVVFLLLFSLPIMAEKKKTDAKPEKETTELKEIDWMTYPEGLAKAAKGEKHVFIDFSTSWCGWCKKMDREVFSDPEVIKMLNDNFVAVKVEGDSRKKLDIDGYIISEADLTRKDYGVRGFPAFWFLKSDGTKIAPLSGYKPKDTFMRALSFVHEKKYEAEIEEGQDKK